MWNLCQFPTSKETIEAWAKILEDIAKVSLIAIPVLVFGKETDMFKIFGSSSLFLTAYCCLIIAKYLRDKIDKFILTSVIKGAK